MTRRPGLDADRQLIVLLVACSLAMAGGARWYYVSQRETLQSAAFQQLSALAGSQRALVANWRQERLGDGQVLAESSGLLAAKRMVSTSSPSPSDREEVLQLMGALHRHFRYSDATLVDMDGNSVLRLSDGIAEPSSLTKNQRRELAFRANAGTEVALSDIDSNNRRGTKLMTMTVPLAGRGAFILEIDPSGFLGPVVTAVSRLSRTGESVLVRRKGNDVVYLTQLRHAFGPGAPEGRSVSNLQIPPDDQLENGAVIHGLDYRGVETFMQARRVPDTDWYVVVKIDASEVNTPVHRLSGQMAVVWALIGLAIASGVGLIWKNRQLRMRQESEERYRALADDTPAFLWTASPDGRHMFLNRALCQFLGIQQSDPSADWTAFLHPEDAPVFRTKLREFSEARQSYSVETRLRRADGTYRWLICEGTPRLTPRGEFLGYAGSLLDITAQKEATQELRVANASLEAEVAERTRGEQEIRALSARLIDAQQEERTRLSRELHDDLSQQIAALSISMGGLKLGIPETLSEPRAQSDRIQQKLVSLSETVRRISHELHPSVLQHSGLAAALRSYCREFEVLSGMHVTLHTEGAFETVAPTYCLHLYRITQEALRNAARHARTDAVQVNLIHRDGEVRLEVADRGVGIDPAVQKRGGGLGLVSIRERSRLMHGFLEIDSAPGKGTRVIVHVPDAGAPSVEPKGHSA